MQLSFSFPSGWYIQLFIIYATFIALLVMRKGHKNKQEIKKQIIVGLLLLLLAVIGEFSGISLKLWSYFPDNWPITVWIGYFGIGLIAYQLVKLVDDK